MAGLPNQISNSTRRRNPDLFGGGAPTEPIARRALHVPVERKIIRVTKSQEDRLNKLEKRFLDYLRNTFQARIGIQDFTFRLGADLRYTPDFSLYLMEQWIFYEVKGGWVTDDSKVKVKTAAAMFPMFDFHFASENGGLWKFQPIPK